MAFAAAFLILAFPAMAQEDVPPTGFSVTPAGGYAANGPVGGPFTPASMDYTLSNSTGASITWSVWVDQSWASLSTTGGALDAGSSATVTVSIGADAGALTQGTYSATIIFTNTGNSAATTRAVDLTVTSGSVAGPMTVGPGGGFTSTGPAGGPYVPESMVYTVTNTGSAPMAWTVTTTLGFISFSVPGGTLAGGASTTVTVAITDQAGDLAPGTYTGNLVFTNTTNGSGNTTKPVTLTISAGSSGMLDVTPDADFVASGPPGGPFTPASQAYTLTNAGTANISVIVAADQTWISLATPPATLAPNESATATISIGETAAALPAGTHTATVTFTNTTNAAGSTTRTVTLTITGTGMSVSPDTGITASGPVGGPFTGATMDYTIKNNGAAPFDWTCTAAQPWVSAFPASGTLFPGTSQVVTVTINALANELPAENYTDTVTFTEASSGEAFTRPVFLQIISTGDTTPPVTTIVSPAPPSASTSASPITITGTATDNVGVTSVTWTNAATGGNGTATGTNAWSATIPLASGSNLITITAKDAANNGGPATITIVYTPVGSDTQPPVVQITSPTTASTWTASGTPVVIGGTASDNVGVTTVTWFNASTGQSGTASGTGPWSASIALNAGANAITVSAFDAAGNSSTDTLTVDYTPPAKNPPKKRTCGGAAGAAGIGWAGLLVLAALAAGMARRAQ